MKQLVSNCISAVSYGFNDVNVAMLSAPTGIWFFTQDIGRIPLPWPVTARNLVLFSGDNATRNQDITVIINKNGVLTALTGTLPQAQTTPLTVVGPDITFVQFDDISYRVQTPAFNAGNHLGFCTELESAGNVFGLSLARANHFSIGTGWYGGAFGNGIVQGFAGLTSSNSTSIAAMDGTITTIVMKNYDGVLPAGAEFTGVIIKNNVIQDGSPGTVDTRCILSAGMDRNVATIALPILRGEHYDLLWYLSAAASFPVLGSIALGIGIIPTNPDYFMMTGGNNSTWGLLSYGWNNSAQGLSDESYAQAPIGPSGIVGRGLYVENSFSIGGTDETQTIRKTGTSTPIVVVTNGITQPTNFIDGLFVEFPQDSLIDLELSNGAGKPFWGLQATVMGAGPPPPFGNLTIIKEIEGGDPTTEFSIDVGGGVIPANISLADGEVQNYVNLPSGSGYSVTEPVTPDGYELVSILVSNGSPFNNITIGDGETVVVTVLNRVIPDIGSGIYELIKDKRQDTIWIDQSLGTTRNAKIP